MPTTRTIKILANSKIGLSVETLKNDKKYANIFKYINATISIKQQKIEKNNHFLLLVSRYALINPIGRTIVTIAINDKNVLKKSIV
jgi:hypothetical protein